MNGERFVAIGDSVGDVLSRDDVEVVELRPTFVIVKATKAAAAEIRQRCGRFITLFDGERAALAVIDLFDHAAPTDRGRTRCPTPGLRAGAAPEMDQAARLGLRRPRPGSRTSTSQPSASNSLRCRSANDRFISSAIDLSPC